MSSTSLSRQKMQKKANEDMNENCIDNQFECVDSGEVHIYNYRFHSS